MIRLKKMCEEEEKDYLMYVLEATAYVSASFAAVIYIWETLKKEFNKKLKKKYKREKDPELGIVDEEDEKEYLSSSRESSPTDSPNSIYSTVRNRLSSSGSNY